MVSSAASAAVAAGDVGVAGDDSDPSGDGDARGLITNGEDMSRLSNCYSITRRAITSVGFAA